MTLENFLSEWNNDSDRVLVHTSGSTGKPKLMMVEKKRMLNSARITCDFLGLKPGDSALLCMSLDYIAGKMVVVRSIERHLHLISVPPSGHPLKDVNKEITFAAMVPMQVYNTLQVPEERERLCHIRHLIIGGGAIDAALEKELKSFPGNIAIWSTYGMTETLSHIALRRINGDEASEWYQPFDSVHISQTEEGCLVIDAPQVCAETLVTNDIVEIEPYIYNKVEKLRFRIKGRKDNVICSGGIKIQIEEVETLLKPHLEKPFMLAKKKDGKFGEIAVLLSEDEDIKRVEATVRRLLSDESEKSSDHKKYKYWIPKEFRYVEHLPLTETGKKERCFWEKEKNRGGWVPRHIILSFSKEVECFFNFFCSCCLVDTDIPYTAKHGEVDDAILVLLVMMHQLDELIIVITGNIQCSVVFLDEGYGLAHFVCWESSLCHTEVKLRDKTECYGIAMQDRLALQSPALESMTEGMTQVQSLADALLMRI